MRTSVPSIAYIPSSGTTAPFRLATLWQRVKLMWQVRKERNALQSLDADRLHDIGIDLHKAAAEAKRSFFDVPDNRF